MIAGARSQDQEGKRSSMSVVRAITESSQPGSSRRGAPGHGDSSASIVAEKPTCKDARAPQTTREKMSRPSSSVPNRWCEDGCASRSLKSVSTSGLGRNERRKSAGCHEDDDDHQAGNCSRAPKEAGPEQAPPTCARADRHDGVVHGQAGAPATLMRGSSSE